MKRETEIKLAKEVLELHSRKSAYLDDEVTQNPVADYFRPDQFALERESIFRALPQPIIHSSELPEAGSFLRRDFAGLPAFFTRDDDGIAHAFFNVCRHRGTRLVDDEQGCKKRFSCPYHAWTWNNRGELIGIPHGDQGFPDVDKSEMGLRRLGCIERNGWLWVWADSGAGFDIDEFLEGLADDFEWFGAEDHTVVHTDVQLRNVNWKILVEGGIEAYHFRVAHKKTIAPYFLDNLSTYQCFGPHIRSVLAKKSIVGLAESPEDEWRLRDHAQVLYSIFPSHSLLVQGDHFAWIHSEPLSATSTLVRLHTLAPSDRVQTDADREHWAKNHAITVATLSEDFDIGESIQSGLESGANDQLTFGCFEGALAAFSRIVNARVDESV